MGQPNRRTRAAACVRYVVRVISMAHTTPFAHWREEGKPDPFGSRFDNDNDSNAEDVAECLVSWPGIASITAGKECLRRLSRKLYRLSADHDGVNHRRADTLFGHYTDDELANAFYLSEHPEQLRAGRHRILWLLKELKEV